MNLAMMTNEVEIIVTASDSSGSLPLCATMMWLLNNNVTLMC